MDPVEPRGAVPVSLSDGRGERRRRRKRVSDDAPEAYAYCDSASGWLIQFLVIFTPWAFGTTDEWAIWTANIACYCLGALLVAKWVIRWKEAFRPARCGDPVTPGRGAAPAGDMSTTVPAPPGAPWTIRALAVVTGLFLALVAISLVNARADFDSATRQFVYVRDALSWLPHTYDRRVTLEFLAQFGAYACAFWAMRDWLLGRTARERKEAETRLAERGLPELEGAPLIPARLRRLLWVLCLSGMALVIMGIFQRAAGTSDLMFLIKSRSGKPPGSVFGPWSYRANAAQYLNLLWPLCLAFWVWLQERASRGATDRLAGFDGPQIVIIPCVLGIATGVIVAGSRGAALIAVGIGLATTLALLALSRSRVSSRVRHFAAGSLVVAGILGGLGGGSALMERLEQPDPEQVTGVRVGSSDFTLLVRLNPWVATGKASNHYLLGFGGAPVDDGWHWRTISVRLLDSGALSVTLYGNGVRELNEATVPGFAASYSANGVVLAIQRSDTLRILADGAELGAKLVASANAPGWRGGIPNDTVAVIDPIVTEVGLVTTLLTPDELARTAQGGFRSVVDAFKSLPPVVISGPALTNGMTLPAGTVAEFSPTALPEDSAVTLQRQGAAGIVGIRRSLADAGPGFRGSVRVTARVSTSGTTNPPAVSVTVDAGPGVTSMVEDPASHEIEGVCRIPHEGPGRSLDIVFVHPERERPVESVPGEVLRLRRLELASGVTSFWRAYRRGLHLDEWRQRVSGRLTIADTSARIVKDHPFWGTGAGTFESMYSLYRATGQRWAAYAHNDWLETRVTLGIPGLVLVVAALLLLAWQALIGRGGRMPLLIPALVWIGLAGCLAHAAFDFPFRVYSVAFLFVVIAAVSTVLSAAGSGAREPGTYRSGTGTSRGRIP